MKINKEDYKMKRKTIEERAKIAWGTTEVPQFAIYMLTDGTMLNGSYEGHQRDIDHREINEFMPCVGGKSYEGYPYIFRFLNRGNIRMNRNRDGINIQFWHTPTYEQWQTLRQILKDAEEMRQSIFIEKYYPNKGSKVFFDRYSFANWLSERVNWCLY